MISAVAAAGPGNSSGLFAQASINPGAKHVDPVVVNNDPTNLQMISCDADPQPAIPFAQMSNGSLPPPLPQLGAMTVAPTTVPEFAQQAAIFSVLMWVFFMGANFLAVAGGSRPPHPVFVLVILLSLPIGVVLGLVGLLCCGRPRHRAVMSLSIAGLALNGAFLLLFLLMVIVGTAQVMSRLHASSAAPAVRYRSTQTPATYFPNNLPSRNYPPPSHRPKNPGFAWTE